MSVHYTLQAAIDTVTPDKHVLACDTQLTSRIGKKFMICHDVMKNSTELNRLVHLHGPHFYEVLLPNRPSRIFVDIETENGVYQKVKEGVATFVKMLQMWVDTQRLKGDFHVLDSSNDKKSSFHIVGGPCLKNPYHVGALIRRLTLFVYSARYEDTQQKFNFESLFDNDGKYIIDEQIYTHNRQFRLCNMSKLNSNRTLRGCTTEESFVQPLNVTTEYLDCLEIDNTEPQSTSKKALSMFTMIDGEWERTIPMSYTLKGVSSDLPSKLMGLRNFCEVWMQHGQVGKCTFNVRNGTYRLATTCKRCSIAQRFHKSNHTYLIVNPWQCEVYQMCFDENCMGKRFKVPVSDNIWTEWRRLIDKKVDISNAVVDVPK